MITLTPAAARQIRESAKQGKMEGMPLRLAALRKPDQSLHYGMGFDDAELEGDQTVHSEGVDIVVAPASAAIVRGMTIDYVELEGGQHHFIFLNPNDPNYAPPAASDPPSRGPD
jgi:iron-sulfur cluster assembly protein